MTLSLWLFVLGLFAFCFFLLLLGIRILLGRNRDGGSSGGAGQTSPIQPPPPPKPAPVQKPKKKKSGKLWRIIRILSVLGIGLLLGRSCFRQEGQGDKIPKVVSAVDRSHLSVDSKPKWKMYSTDRFHKPCSFDIVFSKETTNQMCLTVMENNREIASISLSKPSRLADWEWFGKWDNPLWNDRGYFRLNEVPGSNGEKYFGDQTEGKKSDRWIGVIIEKIN